MTSLILNLPYGSLSFKFSDQAAIALKAEIDQLMKSLKAVAASPAGKATPQKSMEYRYTADVFLEAFCNPNIYPSPFAAKVLLTIRDERIRLTTEVELTRLVDDLSQYLEE